MPPRAPPPFIPPPPSPEGSSTGPNGHVSPPVIPATGMSSPLQWNINDHNQHAYNGYPMSPAYAQYSPYGPPGMQNPAAGSFVIPPVAIQPAGTIPAAAMGVNGFSSNYTGFPEYATTPHSAGLHPMQQMPPTSPAAAAHTPWSQAAGMFGMPPAMTPAMAPGAGQYSTYSQPGALPYGYPPWVTPAVHPAAAYGGQPGGYPMAPPPGWGHTPYGPQTALPPGFQTQAAPAPRPPPPAELPRQHPESNTLAHGDKWSDEVKYGPVLEAFILKRVGAKVEVNPLLMPTPDDLKSRPWLIWDFRFPTSQCQRGPVKSNKSWAEGRDSPATWPRTTTVRIVSKAFQWMIEIQASDPELGVTCGDLVDGVHEFLYARSTDNEYKRASRERRAVIYEWFNRNRSVEDGAPGGRMPQTLLRCDWLGELNQWGGLLNDAKLVKEICGADLPCTFVLVCEVKLKPSDAEIREQEARLATAEAARQRRSRSQTRSRASTSRATSRTRESYTDALSPSSGLT